VSALTIIDPVERLHSNALEFAHRWKAAALAGPSSASPSSKTSNSVNGGETEPLLLTQPTQNVTSGLEEVDNVENESDDDEEKLEEENPREHFWKNLGIAIVQMLGGTGIVFIFSDPMVDVISTLGCLWDRSRLLHQLCFDTLLVRSKLSFWLCWSETFLQLQCVRARCLDRLCFQKKGFSFGGFFCFCFVFSFSSCPLFLYFF
jgi:hypothetical protein